MTGYRSKHFRYQCVQDACYIDSLPEWDWFIDDSFPRGIRPTDIDGMVEIRGHVLFLEEKSAGKHIDEGQRKAFITLAAKPNTTVFVFRPGAKSDFEVLWFPDPEGWQPYSKSEFKSWIRDWVATAETPLSA